MDEIDNIVEDLVVSEPNEISPTKKLYTESNDLVQQIVDETDPSKVKDLTDLFMLNQRKKNLIRLNRLSGLTEILDDEVLDRVNSGEVDNKSLVGFINTTQNAINNIENGINQTPLIQINNQSNEINIGGSSSGLDRDSRQKVLDAVSAIMKSSLQDQNNSDIIDVTVEEGDK